MARTAFVTGSTGFLGTHIVETLLADGWKVVALRRRSSDRRYLDQWNVEQVEGDVLDHASLLRTMPEGVDAVFHVAADTSMWRLGNDRQHAINVGGTRNVVDAALNRGARRFIHTSSIAAFGNVFDTELTEETPSRAMTSPIHYFRSKYLAEQEVMLGLERGLDAVILNPAQIVGPYDFNYTPLMFNTIKRSPINAVPCGNSVLAHARDYARAHVAAFDVGLRGERYLLGGVHASFREIFDVISDILDRHPPTIEVPPFVLNSTAAVMDLVSLITRREPVLTPEKVVLLNHAMRINSSKAERVLGFRTCSLDEMFRDCYRWMGTVGLT